MLETSARLLRLLSLLQGQRFWGGTELAERLEVDRRTLRRDIDRLRSLGYAVESTSGPGGGYQLGTGRKLPPLLLSDDEAVAVAVALHVASHGGGWETHAAAALSKIHPLLPDPLKRRVDAVRTSTLALPRNTPTVSPGVLATLASACRDAVLVCFGYAGRGQTSALRQVEPLRLVSTGHGRWYLLAWDLDRADWRTFRVDRIDEPRVTGERFEPRPPPEDLERYVATSLAVAPFPIQARFRLRGTPEALAERIPPWCGVLEVEDATHCVLTAGASSVDALAAHVAIVGIEMELVEPEHLREPLLRVAERLARAVAPGVATSPEPPHASG